MSIFDSFMPDLAGTMLQTFGTTGVLQLTTPGSYDPLTGTETAVVPEPQTISISPPERVTKQMVDRLGVLNTDFMVMTPGTSPVFDSIENRATLTVATLGTLKVVRVEPTMSGDRAAYYTLILR